MNAVKTTERMGAITGVLAALMIAMNLDLQVLAFILFIISDFLWIYIAVKKKMPELLWMSVIYAIIGIVGIYNWL